MRQHAVVTRCTEGPAPPRPRFAPRLHARLLPRVDPTFLAQTLFLALAHVEVPGDDLNTCGVEVRPAAEEVQLPLAVVSITRGAARLGVGVREGPVASSHDEQVAPLPRAPAETYDSALVAAFARASSHGGHQEVVLLVLAPIVELPVDQDGLGGTDHLDGDFLEQDDVG